VIFHTAGHDHSGVARIRQTPACIAPIFLHIELHFRNRERLQSQGTMSDRVLFSIVGTFIFLVLVVLAMLCRV
jgi:hypothetical protein